MPMLTAHSDGPTLVVRQTGSYRTLFWENGLSIQLDETEWDALVAAVAAHAPGLQQQDREVS